MEKKEIKDSEWVFKDQETEDGVDLDIDQVEETMKPKSGARYIGDVEDKGFVPVGFKGTPSKEKRDSKPKVEFKNPGILKKLFRRWKKLF